MKINVAYPETGLQKTWAIEEEVKIMPFWEKRMGSVMPGDSLGDEWKGYQLKITGGNDKQGFPMMQGVMKNGRVRLLFKDGQKCYRERRNGMRKRKSVRGCIVGHDLAILNLVVVQKGDAEIEGLTDGQVVKRLGPKRASKIRKLFSLEKEDDVKKFVIRRPVEKDGKKAVSKAPKIQRLVTAARLQRKRRVRSTLVKKCKANQEARKSYAKKVAEFHAEQKAKRTSELAKKKKQKESA